MMSDPVALALIGAFAATVPPVCTLLAVIFNRLGKIEKSVNGRQDRNDRLIANAEKVLPGCTQIPQTMETKVQAIINDPTNSDPPIVMQHDSPSIAPIVTPPKGTP